MNLSYETVLSFSNFPLSKSFTPHFQVHTQFSHPIQTPNEFSFMIFHNTTTCSVWLFMNETRVSNNWVCSEYIESEQFLIFEFSIFSQRELFFHDTEMCIRNKHYTKWTALLKHILDTVSISRVTNKLDYIQI